MPAKADAQFYVMLGDRPSLDGKYVVFGQRDQRVRRAGEDPRRRRDQKNVREAVTGATSTRPFSSG